MNMEGFEFGLVIAVGVAVVVKHKMSLEQCIQMVGLASALCRTYFAAIAQSLLAQPALGFPPALYPHQCQPS